MVRLNKTSNNSALVAPISLTCLIRSARFPLYNLQVVLGALSSAIAKDLCDFERAEKYALLGICYHMTLDRKAFKLLPELQQVMEALYINLHAHNQLVIVRTKIDRTTAILLTTNHIYHAGGYY